MFIGSVQQMSAYACTCIGPGAQFIKNNEADDTAIMLPRDARGALWWYGGSGRRQQFPRKDEFTVQLLSGAHERDLDFHIFETWPGTFLIAPLEKLFPGNRYRFSRKQQVQPSGGIQKVEAIVENTAFVEIKDQIELWLSPPTRASLKIEAPGRCSRSADMIAQDVQINGPEAIERWRFALLFDTIVDGKRDWHPRDHLCGDYSAGSSWRGRGTDVIFAECGVGNFKHAGLSEGAHDVSMTISVPGTKLAVVTKKRPFMLTCKSQTLQ